MIRILPILLIIYLVCSVLGISGPSGLFDIYVLVIATGLAIVTYLVDILNLLKANGYKVEKIERDYYSKINKKHELPKFNDVLATELMNVRQDLATIRASQLEQLYGKKHHWHDVPRDFIAKWLLMLDYPHSAICAPYEVSEGKSGQMIILLDEFPDERDSDGYGMELLRKIKAVKKTKIRKDMCFDVHMWDPEFGDSAEYNRRARVLTIDENSRGDRVTLTLEIQMSLDGDYSGWMPEEHFEESKVIRKIDIWTPRYWLEFIT